MQPRGITDMFRKAIGRAIPVEQVQQNMTQFLANIQEILAKGAEVSGEFWLDTIEINAQISAEGQIGFMGNNVGTAGSAGIKFLLKRRSA